MFTFQVTIVSNFHMKSTKVNMVQSNKNKYFLVKTRRNW